MRKSATPTDISRINRLKKHLIKSKLQRKRSQKRRELQNRKKAINYRESALIRAFIPTYKTIGKQFEKNSKLCTPKNFCVFERSEESLLFIKRFVKTSIANPSKIFIDHSRTKKWSLGSESLLGVLTSEVYRLCSKYGMDCDISGHTSKNDDHQDVINSVGIVSELPLHEFDTPTDSDDSLIHTFKQDCTLHESSSVSAKDLNNETAIGFVEHLMNCLKDHKLKLIKSAADNLKACMGELLDNVHEHCGLGTPRWYVRAYINNSSSNRTLEISVFNIGRTFAETFSNLSDNNFSKKIAEKYVMRHRSPELSSEALLTIAALQGNVSSKNEDTAGTRGHGTITLIETFENLYKNYSDLRIIVNGQETSSTPVMNLISGSVVIRFDDKYKSFNINDAGGGERILISFNEESDLAFPPDRTYIKTMKAGFFPGAMINIQVPLNGSLSKIKDK